MNRRIITLVGALAVLVSAAGASRAEDAPAAQAKPAAPDLMSSAYGNTIELNVPPFWSAKQYFEPNHTWRQVASDGAVVGGTWKIENGESCTVQTTPPGPTYCNAYVPRKVGDTWLNQDDAGNTTIISLVAGRK